MGKLGRKSSISPGDITRLEKCFHLGMSVTSACFQVRLSRDAYYRRNKDDEEFRERMEYARSFVLIKAKQNVAVAIVNDGNTDLSKWWIERKDPEFKLGSNSKVEEVTDDKPIDEEVMIKMLNRLIEGQEAKENYHQMVRRGWEEEIRKARELQAKYATQKP